MGNPAANLAVEINLKDVKAAAKRFAPVVSFHQFEQFFPCSIEWLLQRSVLKDNNNATFSISGPTQDDLASHRQDNYYLDIGSDAYAGQPLAQGAVEAPMYVTAQEWDDCIEITYCMLYGFQGGETCRGWMITGSFNCIVNDFGKHQGDLEWVSVLVSKDYSQVLAVGFEAHGDVTFYVPGQYLTEGEHPLVRVALNGHPCRNGYGKNDNDWIYTYEIPFVFGTVDIITKAGATWRPHLLSDGGLVLMGLDDSGKPIGDQVWAQFQGRLGKVLHNSFQGATDVDGHSDLNGDQLQCVNEVVTIGKISRLLPADEPGPDGPGKRDFVQGQRRAGRRWWTYDNGNTGYDQSAPPSIVAYGGLFHVFFRDGADGANGILHITSLDGINWSHAQWNGADRFYTGFDTSAGPCPIVAGNQLHIFFRDRVGLDRSGIFHIASTDGYNFSNKGNIGLDCDGAPAAATLNGTLCVVASDHGGEPIMRAVCGPSSNPWDVGNTGYDQSAPPSIVAYGGLFHVFFRDGAKDANGILHITSLEGINWSHAQWNGADRFYIGFDTSAGPCPIVAGNQLHIFFRDRDGNGIFHIASADGYNFSPVNGSRTGWYNGLDCDGAPAAAMLNGTLCVVASDHGGEAIMRSVADVSVHLPVHQIAAD
jgi:hypothetical protein